MMQDDLDDTDRTVGFILQYFVIFFSYLFSFIPITWLFQIKVMKQYERAVIFRFGKIASVSGPGVFYLHPFVDTFKRIDLRIKNFNVGAQEILTKDSVTIKVDAFVFFSVSNASKAVLEVKSFKRATTVFAATTLRSVVGESELDELLYQRDRINRRLSKIISPRCAEWGVRIDAVEVRDVVLPYGMQRVMASQAEAERDRRGKVISADGERQAAGKLLEAATMLSKNPSTVQLRYLQSLTKLTEEKPSKIYFPIPLNISTH